MITNETSIEVTNTIRQQLGGGRFEAMTGANTFMRDGKRLIFKIPGVKKNPGVPPQNIGVNKVSIELNASDTYDIKFYKIRGINFSTPTEINGVYADNLQEIFTENTGLYTRL